MSEGIRQFGEVLLALLPASDVGRIIYLVIFCWFVLTVTGRFKLEWLAKPFQWVWRRCIQCPLGNHSWRMASVGTLTDAGTVNALCKCAYCGTQEAGDWTI